jgi:hypothetical protein
MLGCYMVDPILSKIEFFDCLCKKIRMFSESYEAESGTWLEPNKVARYSFFWSPILLYARFSTVIICMYEQKCQLQKWGES